MAFDEQSVTFTDPFSQDLRGGLSGSFNVGGLNGQTAQPGVSQTPSLSQTFKVNSNVPGGVSVAPSMQQGAEEMHNAAGKPSVMPLDQQHELSYSAMQVSYNISKMDGAGYMTESLANHLGEAVDSIFNVLNPAANEPDMDMPDPTLQPQMAMQGQQMRFGMM